MPENPYPKMIDCDCSGHSVGNPLHTAWQQGWEEGFWDCLSHPVAARATAKSAAPPQKKLDIRD